MKCEWCKETMDIEAIVCPTCKRERKDFYKLKVAMYVFISISMISIFYAISSGEWYSLFLNEFELSHIFNTSSGLVFIISFVISQILYFKASKIIKTWWWY